MTKPLSLDLRTRIVALVRTGVSRRAAASRFAVSPASAVRFAKLDEERGEVSARPIGRPPGTGKLAAHVDFLIEVVESIPDITGPELAAALLDARNVEAHPSSVKRALTAQGFTFKKNASGRRTWSRRRETGAAGMDQAMPAADA